MAGSGEDCSGHGGMSKCVCTLLRTVAENARSANDCGALENSFYIFMQQLSLLSATLVIVVSFITQMVSNICNGPCRVNMLT